MAQENTDKKAPDKRKEISKERGAKDDWEALKIILDNLPSLKQRVLHKLRELVHKNNEVDKKISQQAKQSYLRELKKSKKENR